MSLIFFLLLLPPLLHTQVLRYMDGTWIVSHPFQHTPVQVDLPGARGFVVL